MSETLKPNPPILLETHALADTELRGGTMVAQGFIAPESLSRIGYDIYQRDLGSLAARRKLTSALRRGAPFPPIELGMRGARTRDTKDGLLLLDPVFAIDGRQRIGTALDFISANPNARPNIGCTVHFNTDEKWERERFNDLNLGQRAVSPSKLLANYTSHPAIGALYGLSQSRDFVLSKRVCWEQNMRRTELLTARVLVMTAGILHGHKVPSRKYSIQEGMLPGMERVVKVFGAQKLKDNVREFFSVIDDAWGCGPDVLCRNGLAQVRGSFLMTVARILSDHFEFWQQNDTVLVVDESYRKRFKNFKLQGGIIQLVEGTIKSRSVLRGLIIEELNKGKRQKLTPRHDAVTTKVRADDIADILQHVS